MREVIEFLGWLECNRKPGAVYRGQPNSIWPITPSAFRDDVHGIQNASQLVRWRHAAGRFANPRPQGDFEWLALAQHYGIATGLLDWTSNPLIALFFACQQPPNVDGTVIMCDRAAFTEFNKPETVTVFDKERGKPPLVDASAMNARTRAQDSFMSSHYGLPKIFELGPYGRTYTVAARDKIGLRDVLRGLGFSAERLYADLPAAAQYFRDNLEAEALISALLEAIPSRDEAD